MADPGQALSRGLGALGYARQQASARKAAMAVALGDGSILCRVLGRYRMVVSAADEGLAMPLALDGYWELAVTRYISDRVKPGMACADIGANVGYFSVLMGDLIGPTGRLTAFEPFAPTFALLERNLRLNGLEDWCKGVRTAIGWQNGEIDMMAPAGEPKNVILQPEGFDFSFGRDHEVVRAPVMCLDDHPFERLDFLKIDIEGAEQFAWPHMQATLDRFPHAEVVLEINRGKYADPRAFYERIAARFPMRAIDFVGGAAPVTVDQLMGMDGDVMLALRRG
jgi:FkbM family methyltransferase